MPYSCRVYLSSGFGSKFSCIQYSFRRLRRIVTKKLQGKFDQLNLSIKCNSKTVGNWDRAFAGQGIIIEPIRFNIILTLSRRS